MKINHIPQQYAAVIDGVGVIVCEEIGDGMRGGKAAGFVEVQGGGAVSGAYLEAGVLSPVFLFQQVYHGLAVALPVKGGGYGDVLDFQGAVSHIQNHTFSLDPILCQ